MMLRLEYDTITDTETEHHMTTQMQKDAAEFGVHIRQGGWRLGLLVARNVQPGAGDRSISRDRSSTKSDKVSARGFALEAGTSEHRVMRHLRAWNRAAESGIVTASTDIDSGAELELDVEGLPDWSNFYTSASQTAKSEALSRQAEADGISPTSVQRITENRRAMASAIKADPQVAAAAKAALAPATPEAKREAFTELAQDADVYSDATTRHKTGQHFSRVAQDSPMAGKIAHGKEQSEAWEKNQNLLPNRGGGMINQARRLVDDAADAIRHARIDDEERELLKDEALDLRHKVDLLLGEIDGTATTDWDAGLAEITQGE